MNKFEVVFIVVALYGIICAMHMCLLHIQALRRKNKLKIHIHLENIHLVKIQSKMELYKLISK